VKKTNTETDQGNFNIFDKANSGSTDISASEFSVADDVIMADQSAKFYTENKELAPLSKKLNKLEDQLYQYIFKNMTDEE